MPTPTTNDETGVPLAAADRDSSDRAGIFPSQLLRDAVARGWISSGEYRIADEEIQPASLDLRLGDTALALRCSFLPGVGTAVSERADDLAFDEVDIRKGGTLERDRPYLVQLREELRLPPRLRARTNPKSSTGRLDVFTRVITDRNDRFDEIAPGYHGKLYLEIVPRTFAIRVRSGMALNQLRLIAGDARVSDQELREIHSHSPLLYIGRKALSERQLNTSDGLFLRLALDGGPDQLVGYRAKKHSLPIDLSQIHRYDWREFWDPVFPERGGRIVLEPEIFYLLLSQEGVRIPPNYAAEMTAYDPTAGELRTHYAGFFDPGFGYDPRGRRHGSRAALEVRARDVAFMVEHLQPVCKLAFERMVDTPDVLYGEALGSNYQGQESMLSKHFTEQTAGIVQMSLRDSSPYLGVPPHRAAAS
ncbi:MAG: dCTP deaminase [Solirubrobacteraceae bacterium]|jgi:dCTP deaminase|nr:dCTP deaminase [Solirubrobacteraceae bacterium]